MFPKQYNLRRWQTGDEATLAKYANNYQVWRCVRDSFPHPYTLQHADEWIQLCQTEVIPTVFAIEYGGEAVGGIGVIQQKDIYRKNAEIGYWLGQPFWGSGMMTEVVKEMSQYAFETFDIQHLYAGVFEYNIGSMRVLEKAGFRAVSVQKKWLLKENQLWDEHLFLRERPA